MTDYRKIIEATAEAAIKVRKIMIETKKELAVVIPIVIAMIQILIYRKSKK